MISVRIAKRAVGLSGHRLPVSPLRKPFCNQNFAMRSFATEPHPPQAPVMELPAEFKWQDDQAVIDALHSCVVEAQKSLDKKTILDQLRTRLTYSSNKLEGNSFREGESQEYIQTGVTVSDKDRAEIYFYDGGVEMVFDDAKEPLKNLTTIKFVVDLHIACTPYPRVGYGDIMPGKLKASSKLVWSNFNGNRILRRFVAPENTRKQLNELLLWAKENADTMPILPFITILHYNFVRIHPFEDTNGRTARLLTALFMLRRSYPPMTIDPDLRKEYLNGLAHADHTRDLSLLCNFFARSIKDTYEELIRLQG